jgi:hypothetical protein
MTKQTITGRQKDISRVIREKHQMQKDLLKSNHALSNAPGIRKKGDPLHQSKSTVLFTDSDKQQIRREGLSERQVLMQIDLFRRGVPYIDLNRPCRVGDGIDILAEEGRERLITLHDEAAAAGRLLKFVPASGAASRMFIDWYRALEEGHAGVISEEAKFISDLNHFPFRADLRETLERAGLDLERLCLENRYVDILSFILTPKGLNYGQLPKALLKFHAYPSGNRTAIAEHLVEAALYVKDARKVSRLHITVSENHKTLVRDHLAQIRSKYEHFHDVIYDIDVSIQESSTNTIAVDMENRPFRMEDGQLYFRPGGHGALLENLNAIDGDIIFLKNIDNIVPDRLKAITVLYKKLLGGYLISLQQKIFHYLHLLKEDRITNQERKDVLAFCREKLHIVFPAKFYMFSEEEMRKHVFKILNRPVRVCGMVKNEDEPGGGPFWVNNEDNDTQSLQIIEAIQVAPCSESQKMQWQSATHFNPVDLVCGVRDFLGRKFDLHRFVNPQTASISRKSEKGKDLKAIEHPGLWNGSMANWNTVFVEVPVATFNPVKTVRDLLRPTHQPAYD